MKKTIKPSMESEKSDVGSCPTRISITILCDFCLCWEGVITNLISFSIIEIPSFLYVGTIVIGLVDSKGSRTLTRCS